MDALEKFGSQKYIETSAKSKSNDVLKVFLKDLAYQNYKKLLPFAPTYKITVVGSCGVGKTALIDTYVSGIFKKYYPLTFHPESLTKIYDTKRFGPLKLNIMDSLSTEDMFES